mgnify:CR=1 FL=1
MTVAEIIQQAKALSLQERKQLVILLIDSLTANDPVPAPKTGAEIAAMLDEMDPVELVDADIEDPVEWVKAQRQREMDRLKGYWDGEQ